MTDQRNLILAVALSLAVLLGFHFFVQKPREERLKAEQAQQTARAGTPQPAGAAQKMPDAAAAAVSASAPGAGTPRDRGDTLADAPRVKLETPRLHGTLALAGGRIDDLTLADYYTTVAHTQEVTLLSPAGSPAPYYAEIGWLAANAGETQALPDAKTRWTAQDQSPLSPGHPVALSWDNGTGLMFTRTVAVDENYLFTVTQSVANHTDKPVALNPVALVSRHGKPETSGYFILHEGPVGVLDGTLTDPSYKDLKPDAPPETVTTKGGWLGFTDKYWLVAVIPGAGETVQARFAHATDGVERFQADYRGAPITIAPGETGQSISRVFAGAKEVHLIDRYEAEQDIPRFYLAVDWGWFRFLTKPFFYVIDWLGTHIGNFGIALLVATLLLRLITFPLARKSFREMNRMKTVQPQIAAIRERNPDDKAKQQAEMMELYRREKINPVAGCLPSLIQLPIFFALYKVLFVTIEMRQAPFFGWIHDLSAPDPTNIFNLFGLLPFSPPTFLALGAWPLIMGGTMFLQQRISPQPPDPMQARIMMLMPVIFTFTLGSFPAGLVIYWAWNNTLLVIQQLLIRRAGAKAATA